MDNDYKKHFKETLDSIHLEEGVATKKLLTAISERTISILLSNYNYLEAIRAKVHSLPSYSRAMPDNELNAIIKQLLRMIDKGWLRKQDFNTIMGVINFALAASPNARKQVLNWLKKETFEGKRPSDLPLNILIFLLVQHINKARLKGKWNLIADFFAEQGVGDVLDAESVKQRYARNPQKKLISAYIKFQAFFIDFTQPSEFPLLMGGTLKPTDMDEQSLHKLFYGVIHKRDIDQPLPFWKYLLPAPKGKL